MKRLSVWGQDNLYRASDAKSSTITFMIEIVGNDAEKCIMKIESNNRKCYVCKRLITKMNPMENHLIYKQFFHEHNYKTECMSIHLVNYFLKL